MQILTHLKPFLKKHMKYYAFGIFLLIAVDVLQMLPPIIIGNFTDMLTARTLKTPDTIRTIFYIIIVAIGVALGRFGWRMTIIKSSKTLEYWLRNRVFAHLETLPLSYYNTHKTGDLMAHATNDINAVRMSFGPGIIMFIDAFFMSTLTICLMMIKVNLKLTLVALAPLPLVAFFIITFGKLIRQRFKRVQEAFSDLSDNVQETFSGMRVIKSFVREQSTQAHFNLINEENFAVNMKLAKISGLMHPLLGFITMLSTLIALVYGGYLVIYDTITVGAFVTFFMYVGMLSWPMMAIGFVYNTMQRGQVSLQRINAILDEPSAFDDDRNDLDFSGTPAIQFKNLTFQYPGQIIPALKDITFDLEAGKTLAIVGKTGSGKTTLMNLLLRLYEVDPGHLFIGGDDITDIEPKSLRHAIGYVPQDNFLFSKEIVYNICFGLDTPDLDTSVEAAKRAQIHDEIISFKDSYQSELGERGVNMSGGQKQRTSIARALAKQPKILCLDDALSAVDTKTEEAFLKELAKLREKTTTLIVSHRVSTVKDADQILYLEQGEILERGTHQSLLSQKGAYYELYQKQLLEEKITKES
ncbi:ABC transporter ATP-binding protein [Fusibacter paucivorans]|uniref:ABC transporter ATP-binding protein n=1 Tax=Fusibacter paucivorans TaxID=76009 RepID=A0ABS5PSZ2_9FIRM|nr:ABC transporter ATP-binding protein [Fusibacter paucivorans]MBS7528294.1 ABC transporter ATP-binding protein [Fusibacter paucivorans]